jgi:glucuronokinase
VGKATEQFAEPMFLARQALLEGDAKRFGCPVNANVDLRPSSCRLLPAHVQMIELARRAGATAQFAGSGGAIVGTCAACNHQEHLGESP